MTSLPEPLQLASDPIQWRLLTELARSDRRVGELTQLIGRRKPFISYHLQQLRDAGLVSARRSSADARHTYYVLDQVRWGELLSRAGALHPNTSTTARREAGHRTALTRLLFTSTSNSARSQIAEALAEEISRGAVIAASAGSRPKAVHPNAVRVMRAQGIDLSRHRSKRLAVYSDQRFDYVIALCDRVHELHLVFPGEPARIYWSVHDPAQHSGTDDDTLPAFEAAAAEIATRLRLFLEALEHNAGNRVASGV